MGKILGIDGKPAEEDINLKASQWILILDMDLATDVVTVTQDLGTLPPKTYEQKKVSEDNNFTTLCNALAQIVGHLITNGVPREYCFKKIEDALVHNIMPAEEGWKTKGGKWKLFLVFQPTTGLLAIRRSTGTDQSIKPGEEKDAVNKDFYLVCKGMHTFIQHLISNEVPAEKMTETIFDVIDTYLAVGRMSGQRAKIEMTIEPPQEDVTYDQLLKDALEFMQRLLPSHYNCVIVEKTGIRCVSNMGIDNNTEQGWKYVELCLKQKFGTRLSKVTHRIQTKNMDFTVILK